MANAKVLGVPKETAIELGTPETRVALTPEAVKILKAKGFEILIEKGAGEKASISDAEFEAAGAMLASDLATLFEKSNALLKVQPPSKEELARLAPGKILVSFLWHLRNPAILDELNARKVTAFSMDAIPRITRAQSMDALSSMSTISGYKAVLLAAQHLPKFLPMLTTAAGTIRPAQGLILGAGVAGLQAIATARRLGAVAIAFDARAAAKEQVLSLGATFLDVKVPAAAAPGADQDKYGYAKEATAETLKAQQEAVKTALKTTDFAITTAQVPGKAAPRLITADMLIGMKPGSVIIDLAAETGGNCEGSKFGETIVKNGVKIISPVNLPGDMPLDASRMYSKNVTNLILDITKDAALTMDWNNEVFRETCLTIDGRNNDKRGTKS